MSSILISIILSVAPYHCGYWGQDTALRKEDLKVVMYPGTPPEFLGHPSEDIRKVEQSPALTAKVAADGKFEAGPFGTLMNGRIIKIDGDKIEIFIEHSSLGSTGSGNIKATVKLNEPITPRGFGIGSIIHLFYFRITKNTEEIEAKPIEFH